MPESWNGILSTDRSEAALSIPGLPLPIHVRRHPRARRWKMKLDHERGVIVLTCPLRGSVKSALEWATGQRDWVVACLADAPPVELIEAGHRIPLDGQETLLTWDRNLPREVCHLPGELKCGGERTSFPARIERWLRAHARRVLTDETSVMATKAGVSVRSVNVGDAGTRWGSCSAAGAIRYNWRLIMAPRPIRLWVVAHEVAHRIHMDHGPEFRALEARLYEGDTSSARSELRRIGARLKRIRGTY